jgi:hypothetical protein
LEAPVITVGNDAAVVEEDLSAGRLSCPCGGQLGGHGWAVLRAVFAARGLEAGLSPDALAGREPAVAEARPRRGRCRECGATHVLLPAWMLLRRCDGTAVIGDMIVRAARGQGPVQIADETGVPEGTVRDRLGRFRGHAGRVRAFFTALAGALSPDPVPLDPAGRTGLADAAASVGAAWVAAGARWAALAVSAWEFAAVQTRGSLLSPLVVFRAVHGDAMPSALG